MASTEGGIKVKKKKESADFRYDTGVARIPWAAVGESIREKDVIELARFLLPPDDSMKKEYNDQFKRVAEEVIKLISV